MLGSISLCGGARSNCPYPQKVSRGRNIRSVLSCVTVRCAGSACADNTRDRVRQTNIHNSACFMRPPQEIVLHYSEESTGRTPNVDWWSVDRVVAGDSPAGSLPYACLLYTSDAADERSSVDL